MIRSHSTTIALLGLVFATACGSSMKRTNSLLDDVNAYNDGVRWRQYPKAAARIHPKERASFVAELVSLEEEVRISDWEILHIEYEGEDHVVAKVLVRYNWFLDSRGLLKTTSTIQTWKLFGKRWLVTAEDLVTGERMPWIPEKAEEPDKSKKRAIRRPRTKKSIDGGEPSPQANLGIRQMVYEFR